MGSAVKTAVVKYIRKGEKGDGVSVLSTEVRYAASASGTTAPASGWQVAIPAVPQGYYLWTRTIVRYSDGTSTTSYTVSRQGIDGSDGSDGATGSRGPVLRGPINWDDCASGFQFFQGAEGESFFDIVLHKGAYYVCLVSHTKSTLREPGVSSVYWAPFADVPFVATRILLAQYALVKNLGVETIEMKDSAGNVVFQAKDGNVTCKTGVFDGITVRNAAIESGTISGFTFNNSLKQLLAGTVGATDNMLLSQKLIRFLSGAGDVGMFIGSTAIQDVLYTAYGPMRINVSRPGTAGDTNIGALIEVSGAPDSNTTSGGNYAFYIRKGNIAGFRPKLRRIASSTTLTVMDTSVVITGSTAVTITLPSASCEDGQEYRMIAPGGASVTVNAGTGYTITGSGGSFKSNRWHLYIFDKVNKTWRYSYMNID